MADGEIPALTVEMVEEIIERLRSGDHQFPIGPSLGTGAEGGYIPTRDGRKENVHG